MIVIMEDLIIAPAAEEAARMSELIVPSPKSHRTPMHSSLTMNMMAETDLVIVAIIIHTRVVDMTIDPREATNEDENNDPMIEEENELTTGPTIVAEEEEATGHETIDTEIVRKVLVDVILVTVQVIRADITKTSMVPAAAEDRESRRFTVM